MAPPQWFLEDVGEFRVLFGVRVDVKVRDRIMHMAGLSYKCTIVLFKLVSVSHGCA